jgi:metallophosphoesterase superfamily enzyme
MLVLNDLHLGVVRSGGTTPQSQAALRDWLRSSFASMLPPKINGEVTINGDLFDGFTVDTAEVIKVYDILADWLRDDYGQRINLIQGNHDWNPRGDKMSSFHLLAHFLQARFGAKVRVYDEGFAYLTGGVWCIPHMPNQALFDLEIEKAIACTGTERHLLLHCNYKNGFAENSDHSLNINDDQVGRLMIAGWNLVLGHEHVGYELRGGRVIVTGNQFPSSVADCLGNKSKRALFIEGDCSKFATTWEFEQSYAAIDWQDLALTNPELKFIRVTGEAKAAQAADVIKTISFLRQKHPAFVITNAVKIEGADALAEMAEIGLEGIKAFDVMGAIYENLDEPEIACVKGLL